MSSSVDLTGYPYFDLYDRQFRYTKILPYISGITQPRDLLEVQSTLQDQIKRFADTIYVNGTIIDGCIITINQTKTIVSISPGHVYLDGQIEEFLEESILNITGVGLEVIGLVKKEKIVTVDEDSQLRNPATNYDKYDNGGSNRLKITWEWAILGIDKVGVPARSRNNLVVNLIEGNPSVITQTVVVDNSQQIYNQLLAAIAQRDYAHYGNYIVSGLNLHITNHPQYPFDMKQLTVAAGTARILGQDTKLNTNWTGNIAISRDTSLIQNEPWTFQPYDSLYKTGGQLKLAMNPVSSVINVIATVLTVDGYNGTSYVTRGTVSGGSDRLYNVNISEIVAVNQGGIWDPDTEAFYGGTTYPINAYAQVGNAISWNPIGQEPDAGSTYAVAYKFRKSLKKQIMVMTLSENEILNKGLNDKLLYSYICETNDFTGISFYLTKDLYVEGVSTTNYVKNVDFTVLDDGTIDWYNHVIQEITLTRSANTVLDIIPNSDILSGYSLETILSVASLDGVFDEIHKKYMSGTMIYEENYDYAPFIGDFSNNISWLQGSSSYSPEQNTRYKVALLIKKPKSSNQPLIGNDYYATYYYWKIAVPGDYLCRDSFYKVYNGDNASLNQLQHYGLDLCNSINFWKSYNYLNNKLNMNKPYPGSLVTIDYDYYLSKYLSVKYTNTGTINVLSGVSSDNPIEPDYDEDIQSLLLGNIYLPADGLNTVLHEYNIKSYKISEMRKLESRINSLESNLANTWLDIQAKNIYISNKVGITTSSFINDDRIDKGWPSSSYAIDPDWQVITLSHVDNFINTSIDTSYTTGSIYSTIGTLTPVGVNVVTQDKYTNHVSLLSPTYSSSSNSQRSQSTSMNIFPSGDFLTMPLGASLTSADSDYFHWIQSPVFRLNDPSPWFNGGWRGNQSSDSQTATQIGGSSNIVSNQSNLNWTESFLQSTRGYCRQILISFVVYGLPPSNLYQVDYFLYFGGVKVDITPTNSTPVGSIPGTIRPKTDKSASGNFMIPYGISPGNIEVRLTSSPTVINGTEWQFTSSAIYHSVASNTTINKLNNCRCNCYSCNRCANCWTCSGRCGTGPLAESLNITNTNAVLKSIDIDYYSVSNKYGVIVSVINTENGHPTSDTISNNMLGRKYLNPTQLIGAGLKSHIFDDPIILNKGVCAFLVTAEDGFNLNASSEITAGRDIQVKTSEVGQTDLTSNTLVASRYFTSGSFFESTSGITWTENDKTDLKFRANFNIYPINTTQIIQMQPISVQNVTSFICAWNSNATYNTNIVFQYSIGNGIWNQFFPYTLTDLSSVTNTLIVRALLSSSDATITPYVETTCNFYVQSRNTDMSAVMENFELNTDEYANQLDIWIDSHLPIGFTQKIRVSFNNGVVWLDLNKSDGGLTGQGFMVELVSVTPINLNKGQETYTYHWTISLPSSTSFSSFRTELNLNSSLPRQNMNLERPTLSNYIAISSNV